MIVPDSGGQDPKPQPASLPSTVGKWAAQDPVQQQQPQAIDELPSSRVWHDRSEKLYLDTFSVAVKSDPDKRARAQALARDLGVDPSTAESNYDVLRPMAQQIEMGRRKMAELNPTLARSMADLEFARIAHDQIDNLGFIEGAIRSFEAGGLEADVGELSWRSMYSPLSPDDSARLKASQERLAKLPPSTGGFVWGPLRMGGQMTRTIPQAFVAGSVLGTGSALIASAASGPLAPVSGPTALATGFGVGATMSMVRSSSRIEGGLAYQQYLANGYGRDLSARAASVVGPLNGALEAVGQVAIAGIGGKVARTVLEPVKRRIMGEAATALVAPTTSKAAIDMAMRVAGAAGGEVGTEVMQEATTMLGEQWASIRSENPEKMRSAIEQGQFLTNLGEIAKVTAQSVALLSLPGPIANYRADAQRVARGNQQAAFIRSMVTNVAESKLLDRAPDAYMRHVAATVKDGNAETAYIDGQQFVQVLQQQDKAAAENGTPSPLEKLNEEMPGLIQKIEEAAANGEFVAIPTEQWVGKLLRTATGQALVEHWTFNPETPTIAETRKVEQSLPDMANAMKAEANEIATKNEEFGKQADQAAAEMQTMLVQTRRMQNEEARVDADLYRAMVLTGSARDGMTPQEWHAAHWPKVQAAVAPQEGAQQFAQDGDRRIDTPEFRNWFGDSKVVDAQGKPLVVYHGTDADFTAFNADRSPLMFFSQNKSTAGAYAYDRAQGRDGRVVEAYVSASNPATAADVAKVDITREVEALADTNPKDAAYLADRAEFIKSRIAGDQGWLFTKAAESGVWRDVLIPALKRAGFDALQLEDAADTGKSIAVFDPTQIKSVNNRGTFDGTDPNILRQGGEGSSRGGYFRDAKGRPVINLYEAKNASTFLHELAHWWLDTTLRVAATDTATAGTKADAAEVLRWFGVADLAAWDALGFEGQRPHHEAFARNFEVWLHEGRAPSAGLKKVFARIASWMRAVYTNILATFNEQYRAEFGRDLPALTPEVRGMFQRMLASQAEIEAQAARTDLSLRMLTLEQATKVGFSEAEWRDAQALERDATDEAVAEFQARLMKDARWLSNATARAEKDMNGAERQARAEVAREVAAEIADTTVEIAREFIKKGTVAGEKVEGEHKLDTEAVRKMLGLEVLDDAAMAEPVLPAQRKVRRGRSMAMRIRQLGGISWASWGDPKTRTYPGETAPEYRRALPGVFRPEKDVVRGPRVKWVAEVDGVMVKRPNGKSFEHNGKVISPTIEEGSDIAAKQPRAAAMSWEAMAQELRAEGYAPLNSDPADSTWFLEAMEAEASGTHVYSSTEDAAQQMWEEPDTREPESDEEKAARLADEAERRAMEVPIQSANPRRELNKLRGMVKQGGMDPNEAAMLLGYDSGEALVRDLLTAPSKSEAIQARVDERMATEFSSLIDPKVRRLAIEDAIHNEAATRFVATVLRTAEGATRPVRELIAAAKMAAEQIISQRQIRTINVRTFVNAEAKAAKDARDAMKKGDVPAMRDALRRQLVNQQLVILASDTQRVIDADVRKLGAVFGANLAKTHDMDRVMLARALMAAFGLGKGATMPREWLASIVKNDPEKGAELSQILAEVTGGNTLQDYRDLTLERWVTVRDAITEQFWLARRDNQIEADGKRVLKAEAIAEMAAQAAAVGKPMVDDRFRREMDRKALFALGTGNLKGYLQRVEFWARAMDGNQADGPFQRYMFRPLRDRFSAYEAKRVELFAKLRDGLRKLTLPASPIASPFPKSGGGTYTFQNKGELIGAMMHMGNRGEPTANLDNMLLGNGWAEQRDDGSVDYSGWDRFIQDQIDRGVLAKEDFEFLEMVWTMNEQDLLPVAQTAAHDLTGLYMETRKAVPFTNTLGTWKGGYVPAQPDSQQPKGRTIKSRSGLDAIMEGERSARSSMPATRSGFRIKRVASIKPIIMDVHGQLTHIDDVLRYAYLQPAINDVAGLLKSNTFSKVLEGISPGIAQDLLIPWLERTAFNRVAAGDPKNWANKLFGYLRRVTGLAYMAWSLPNALQQFTGLGNSTIYVPGGRMRAAAWDRISGRLTVAGVVGQSAFMRERLLGQSADVRADIDLMLDPSKWGTVQRVSDRYAMVLQRWTQQQVDLVTWAAARTEALSKGRTEAQAVSDADSAVRLSQGSADSVDIAKVEAAAPFVRLFLQFHGYFNTVLNQVAAAQGLDGKTVAALRGLVVPTMLSGLIASFFNGDELDDEDGDGWILDEAGWWLIGNQTKGAMAMVPGGSVLARLMTTRDGERASVAPAADLLKRAYDGAREAAQAAAGEPMSGADVRNLFLFLSLSGVPMSPVGRAAGYGTDVGTGKTQPTGAWDFTRGMLTGNAGEASRGR